MDYCNDKEVIDALQSIAIENGGILRPDAVVEAAREDDSPLHSKFQWDDNEAAHQYRLWQARTLIRVTVNYIDDGKNKTPYRVFVSLTPDRQEDSGGYRTMVSVMNDADMRKQLLADAFADMEHFEKKYRALKELAVVFSAMKKVRRKK